MSGCSPATRAASSPAGRTDLRAVLQRGRHPLVHLVVADEIAVGLGGLHEVPQLRPVHGGSQVAREGEVELLHLGPRCRPRFVNLRRPAAAANRARLLVLADLTAATPSERPESAQGRGGGGRRRGAEGGRRGVEEGVAERLVGDPSAAPSGRHPGRRFLRGPPSGGTRTGHPPRRPPPQREGSTGPPPTESRVISGRPLDAGCRVDRQSAVLPRLGQGSPPNS